LTLLVFADGMPHWLNLRYLRRRDMVPFYLLAGFGFRSGACLCPAVKGALVMLLGAAVVAAGRRAAISAFKRGIVRGRHADLSIKISCSMKDGVSSLHTNKNAFDTKTANKSSLTCRNTA